MKAQWQAEKSGHPGDPADRRPSWRGCGSEVDQATRRGDLQRAAELRYGRIPELERKIAEDEKRLHEVQAKAQYLKEEVDAEDIAEIVAKWTGIPVTKMLESERERLTRLEDELGRRVDRPGRRRVTAVANAVRRSRAGLGRSQPADRVVHLPGPHRRRARPRRRGRSPSSCSTTSGRMVRLDMSEYMEKHSVARMIGAPPGYVGYEEGGQLTEAVRRRPYSVVLFDEIEKAHPDVFNVLLQILDDGRLTDSQGRVVDFRNTVIIMTSNIGSQLHRRGGRAGRRSRRGARSRSGCATSCATTSGPSSSTGWTTSSSSGRSAARTRPDRGHPAAPASSSCWPTRHLRLEVTPEARELLADRGLRSGLRRPAAQAGDPARAAEPDRAGAARRDVPRGRHDPGGARWRPPAARPAAPPVAGDGQCVGARRRPATSTGMQAALRAGPGRVGAGGGPGRRRDHRGGRDPRPRPTTRRSQRGDPTAHAELLALQRALRRVGRGPASLRDAVRHAGAVRPVRRRDRARQGGPGGLRGLRRRAAGWRARCTTCCATRGSTIGPRWWAG